MDVADTCPRCGGGFHCGVGDTAPCACTTLTLSAELIADLRARYTSCLCLRCLGELSRADNKKAGPVLRPAGSDGDRSDDQSFL